MARAVTTIVTCDMCEQAGNTHTTDVNTYSFQYSGTGYEIDLCQMHGQSFENQFGTWIGFARRMGAATTTNGRRSNGRRATASTQTRNLKDVREWARGNGFKLGDRGRIPREVLDAYDSKMSAAS